MTFRKFPKEAWGSSLRLTFRKFPKESNVGLTPNLGGTKKQSLKLNSKDGIKFKADFYESENPSSPAVLILPGMSGDRKPYGKISEQLQLYGFNVLSINYYKLDPLVA